MPGRRRWCLLAVVLTSTLALMGETAVPGGDTAADRRAAAEEFLAVVPVGEEVDAYATPEGHAVREKLPKAIDDVMPLIREELGRTVRRLPR